MQHAVSDPMLGRLVDGRYEVSARIARGGMATVYRALDRRLDRTVALKVMHPHLADSADFVARFRREARAAARLNHPGIVAIYDQGHAGDTSYLTMELIEGPGLHAELRREGAFTLRRALDVIEGVLEALATAHRAGVVHRDVKPENVLLESGGRPKVTDFGLARAVTEATVASTGTVLGTVAYLAPEIVTSGLADARADVYATGVMLFELITGAPPFVADQPIRVAFQHVNDGVPLPSTAADWIPAEIDDLVTAMTARDPQDRPTDADAALTLLRHSRAALDAQTLDRRADLAPTATTQAPSEESGATAVTSLGAGTVALPLGAIPLREPDGGQGSGNRRRRVLALSLLLLALGVVAAGLWWWFEHGPGAYTEVPQVIGLSEDEAVEELTAQDLAPQVEREHHDTAPENEVFASDPGPGEPVRTDAVVVLHVSLGILMVEVPSVVGLSEEEAVEELEAAGLDVEVEGFLGGIFGRVGSMSPDAGEMAAPGTTVTLTVF